MTESNIVRGAELTLPVLGEGWVSGWRGCKDQLAAVADADVSSEGPCRGAARVQALMHLSVLPLEVPTLVPRGPRSTAASAGTERAWTKCPVCMNERLVLFRGSGGGTSSLQPAFGKPASGLPPPAPEL